MRTALLLLTLFALFGLGRPAAALDVNPYWGQDFRKYVATTCGKGEDAFCQKVCGNSRLCIEPEGYCRDCAGTASLFLKDLLDTLGDLYNNLGAQVPMTTVAEYLKDGAFVTLTSDTVYNYIDSYNSPALQARFQRLCDGTTPRPVLFVDADPATRELKDVNFVLCRNSRKELVAYKVGRTNEVDPPHPLD